MYNTNYLSQIEGFRRYLSGNTELSNEGRGRLNLGYIPPSNVSVLECKEDVNGEWVPVNEQD